MNPGRKAGAKSSITVQTHIRLVELSMPSILAQTDRVTRILMPESIPFVLSEAVLYRHEHGPQYSASSCRRSLGSHLARKQWVLAVSRDDSEESFRDLVCQ